MKRYLVFSGMTCYPEGGWLDFDADFDDLDAAFDYANLRHAHWTRDLDSDSGWAQVVDANTGEEVIDPRKFGWRQPRCQARQEGEP